MQDRRQHISDEDLLLATGGETGRRARRVRSHLESCACCRNRAARMERLLIDLARAERSSIEAELPSIAVARAKLRIRMAEMSAGNGSFFSWCRISGGFLARALSLSSLAALITVAGFLAFRSSTVADKEPTLPVSDHGVLPNRAFTPGVARQASLAEVCSLPHEEVVKAVSPMVRQKVLAEYGISAAQSDRYEVDYLITPGLGGNDDLRNLWPEPYNAEIWNAYAKDALEERLHEMVCSHRLDLSVAQEAISTNWIAAYQKYVAAPGKGHNVQNSLLRRS